MKPIKALVMFLSLAIAFDSRAEQTPEQLEFAHALEFVKDVSTYQGMFDSVVKFCEPHAPPHIVAAAKRSWLEQNNQFLTLRDSELSRLVELAKSNGAEPEGVKAVQDWGSQYYLLALNHDRLYKDIQDSTSLDISCSRRLGEMLATNMRLENIRPKAYQYAQRLSKP
jgi:hypothetical protein